jgi:tetratricopeptide (TPR) repeat protein
MKKEVNTILEHLECEKEREILLLRNQFLSLSESHSSELQQIIYRLLDAIKQTNIQSHKYVGFYYFFLGCSYYEQSQYKDAILSLQSAVAEMWGSTKNKSLTRWMLGLSHSNVQDFPKARNELQEALHLLATNIDSNSPRTEREYKSRQTIQQKIQSKLEQLFNEPLFRTGQSNPAQITNRFPVQDPPEGVGEGNSISISITSENPSNIKTSSNILSSGTKPKQTRENIKRNYETRTDDDGYLIIPAISIYEEYTRAGRLDEPKPIASTNKFAEFHQVNIEGILYTIHSLKSNTKRINLIQESNWGWIKVRGKSMNDLKGKISINDGDYVLFQKNYNANDNDIVIAIHKDNNSTHVKRLRKVEKMLYSETTEKGEEYQPIDMKENNVEVMGIVYAVAKPIIPQPY